MSREHGPAESKRRSGRGPAEAGRHVLSEHPPATLQCARSPKPMPLIVGTRLGPYEILSALGAGGRGSALDLAERFPAKAKSYENATVWRFPRRSARGHAEPRTSDSEARHQREFALGVGPQRQ